MQYCFRKIMVWIDIMGSTTDCDFTNSPVPVKRAILNAFVMHVEENKNNIF